MWTKHLPIDGAKFNKGIELLLLPTEDIINKQIVITIETTDSHSFHDEYPNWYYSKSLASMFIYFPASAKGKLVKVRIPTIYPRSTPSIKISSWGKTQLGSEAIANTIFQRPLGSEESSFELTQLEDITL